MDLVTAIIIVLALAAVLVAVFIIIGRIKERSAPEEKTPEAVQKTEIDSNTAEEAEEIMETEEQPEEEPQKSLSAKGICPVCGERLNEKDSFCPVCGEKV